MTTVSVLLPSVKTGPAVTNAGLVCMHLVRQSSETDKDFAFNNYMEIVCKPIKSGTSVGRVDLFVNVVHTKEFEVFFASTGSCFPFPCSWSACYKFIYLFDLVVMSCRCSVRLQNFIIQQFIMKQNEICASRSSFCTCIACLDERGDKVCVTVQLV